MEDQFKNIRDTLFSHYLKQEIFTFINDSEKEKLVKFGQDYGAEALELKLTGIFQKRIPKNFQSTIIQLWKRATQQAQVVMGKIMQYEKRTLQKKTPADQKFVQNFIQVSSPILQLLTSIKFMDTIINRYFGVSELETWDVDLGNGRAQTQDFFAELEERAGKSITELINNTADTVIDETMVEFLQAVKDYQQIVKNKDDQNYEKSLQNEDFSSLVNIFSKI